VERAAILCDDDPIGQEFILFSHEMGKNLPGDKEMVAHGAPETGDLRRTLARYEKQIIEQSLHQWPSIRKSAKALGISHTALRNKIKKYHIEMETK
jgi:transcriptional regulator of aroF, aroG, tyrA and aromatic amino acid transport